MKRSKTKYDSLPAYEYSPTDPLGSYTGRPKDNEKPVQDADDL